MNLYKYSQLEKSHVRLFRFSITVEGKLKAAVDHVHLYPEAKIVYNGLSHDWDSSKTITSLICDGKQLPITTELEEALFEIIKSHQDEPLWINEISIDKENIVEKSEQVKMMNLIFESMPRLL
jgi:hypothetical protein